MPNRAMCLGALPLALVFAVRQRLKMIWSDTGSIAAHVVNLVSLWDRTHKEFVADPMSLRGIAIQPDLAIAIFALVSSPHETIIVGIKWLCHLRDKSILK
jgi:hypothetical protein